MPLILPKDRLDKWDRRWIDNAAFYAAWSKDPNTKVGCVIVRPNRTLASHGYNGLPQAVEDAPKLLADKARKLECVIHAEENALLWSNEPLDGYSVYVWGKAICARCAAKLIQKRVGRVVSPWIEPGSTWRESAELAFELFASARTPIEVVAYLE